VHVAYWHLATFRGDAAIRSLSERSGHSARRVYLIDIENAVIVDVEATPARTYDEVVATKTMITRTEERLGLKAKRLSAQNKIVPIRIEAKSGFCYSHFLLPSSLGSY
jgi:hypothetical protein